MGMAVAGDNSATATQQALAYKAHGVHSTIQFNFTILECRYGILFH